ncbi:DNA circularization N-terminal domain-containing protein [Acetobacter suratthaniensis]|uniref:DNA circularization N-terminal domain-containing protein n=1 Tax=Acetobacter suratthaniensis TaxID=1502841 RepID=A0ABS3LMB7_9PROT|nr:DNA circularization N-terminal domain-containing protein [Acetobacter suratthaniensis]MBO1328506.1 DNA circularization N-terminal domain-containing protein [Acetobacter suratthaniensis]MCX2566635.1 DNA circularization N-terminal domain-containing protein [Acetobacter suratthaniensis]
MSGTLNQIGSTVGNVAGTASGVLSTAKSLTGTLSTAVGMLNGSVGAMGGLANLSGLGGMTSLIAATLAEASFRGVTFSMPASEDEVGRRVVQMFFPGMDDFALQDLGALDGPIHIRGLICGDDYVYRAGLMRAALATKGPATLVHPWWGELKVRLVGEPARIGFDENRLGIATLEMTVVREPKPVSAKKNSSSFLDSLTRLLNKADSMLDAATSVMRQVLSPLLIGVSLVRSVENSVSEVGAMFSGLIASASEPVSTACASSLAVLSTGLSVPKSNTGTVFADTVTDALVAVPVAIANAVLPAPVPAVASVTGAAGATQTGSLFAPALVTTTDYLGQLATQGAGGVLTLAPTPAAGTALLIAAARGCLAVGSVLATEPGGGAALSITLVAATACVTQAIATASAITFVSTQDAQATRDALVSVLNALADAVVRAAAVKSGNGVAPSAIVDLFSAIQSTRAAVYADISAQLGRLPSVMAVSVPVEMNPWVLSYALAGDTAANVVPMLDDIVIRNTLLTPAIIPAGTIHVLEQTI